MLAEIIGGIAVIVSMLYLAYEVRQNTAATRSITQQQIMDSAKDINLVIGTDPELAKLIVKSNSDYDALREHEKIQLTFVHTNYFNMWHSAFGNWRSGFLNQEDWDLWNSGMGIFGDRFTDIAQSAIDKDGVTAEQAQEIWRTW